jgi:hypothetical protein
MLVFGEIISFESTCVGDIPSDACIFVIFNVEGREPETTIPVRGVITRSGYHRRHVFLFNRPITQECGARMFFQVVQVYPHSGKQKLIGYGYSDLRLDGGRLSSNIDVLLWRPATKSKWSELFGFIQPLVEPGIVELPSNVDRKDIQSITVNGKLSLYIQKSGYH